MKLRGRILILCRTVQTVKRPRPSASHRTKRWHWGPTISKFKLVCRTCLAQCVRRQRVRRQAYCVTPLGHGAGTKAYQPALCAHRAAKDYTDMHIPSVIATLRILILMTIHVLMMVLPCVKT